MIRDVLAHVTANFLIASADRFAGHPLAIYLRGDAPEAVREALNTNYYKVVGSPGQGQWADVPWIGVFDPIVTTSAVRGYYIGYLFAADMKSVSLFLGQGTTAAREDFGAGTHDALRRFAGVMRDRLPEAKGRFSTSPIELHGHSTLARDYEPALALHATYRADALPTEEILRADLRDMVRFYTMLVARGGRDNFEDMESDDDNDGEAGPIIERKRYRRHRKIERNSKAGKLAKKVHGFVCQCCEFDFGTIYGAAGAKYIEAHHLTPLSELPEDVPVSQDPKTDFAVLCANCHRMIHRKDMPKTVAELRELAAVGNLREWLSALRGKRASKS